MGLTPGSYQYDIQLKPTQKHGNADGLSQLPVVDKNMSSTDDDIETTLFNFAQIDCLPVTAQQVQKATAKDAILSCVLQYTKTEWPATVDDSLQAYFNKQQEITLQGGCLLWGIRVIVPEKLQKKVLDELHMDHLGIMKMKNNACSYIWWPEVDRIFRD